MQTCSICQSNSPDSSSICSNCQADLSQSSTTAVALKRMQENSRVSSVSVAVAHDCCPACLNKSGNYPKDQTPILPVMGCSHNLGCRCFYQPVLETLYP